MENNNLIIYSCFHKEYEIPKATYISPIQVGVDVANQVLNFQGDNIGENISYKNKNYCELTAQYWIWKNSSSKKIGLAHYRRYLQLSKKSYIECENIKINEINDNVLDNKYMNNILKKYEVILPRPKYFACSVYEHYSMNHDSHQLDEIRKIVLDKYPDYVKSYDAVMNGNKLSCYNMLLTDKKIFDSYSKWLFDILFTFESITEIPSDPYQARIFGFISERLLNVYFHKHRYKTKYVSVLFIDDKKTANLPILKYYIDRLKINLKFNIKRYI